MIARAGILTLVLVAAAGRGDPALSAQSASGDVGALRERVERRFDILPLREGLALRPRETGRGVRSIEIAAGTISIDGMPVTGAELQQKLGEDADLVLQLSYLGTVDRGVLFGTDPGISPPAASLPPPSPSLLHYPRAPRNRRPPTVSGQTRTPTTGRARAAPAAAEVTIGSASAAA